MEINEKLSENIWWDKKLIFKWWKLAPQCDGSVVVKLWDTELLITTVMKKKWDEDKDFTPLTIDFRDSFYATWKIWWAAYTRREWRPANSSVLIARLTDRPIRPMLPEWMTNDLCVTITPLQIDKVNNPWVLSIIWSSLGIMLAWIEFEWPVGAVRLWFKDWEYIINPTSEELETSEMNLVIAWTKDTITMVECWSKEISTEVLMWAFEVAQKEIYKVCEWQEEFLKQFEIKKLEITLNKPSQSLIDQIINIIGIDRYEWLYNIKKMEFEAKIWEFQDKMLNHFKEQIEDKENTEITESKVKIWCFKALKKILRKNILENEKRQDLRKLDQIRPLFVETWTIEKAHGCWLFQRWLTQWMTITTLWAPWDVLLIDDMENDKAEVRYFHHYNFPPFSVNEAMSKRATNRRELWHGRLAEKAIEPVLPSIEEFPYTIRTVTEILSSNWSTSMAATCGSTLSLMDAWVPIKAPVSWIAMGLVTDENLNYKILTDIQGLEDFTWDMDFKITWTKKWITAIQMDMKIKWLKLEIIKDAIDAWNKWRLKILDFMLETIPEPRKELKPNAPKITSFKLENEQIKLVIWKWWENINKIIEDTWVKIDFKEDGTCLITSLDQESAAKAKDLIFDSFWEPKVWDIINWKVTRIEKYWLFVDLWKGKMWLCHVKNLSSWFISDTNTLFKIWDKIKVKVFGIDNDGKIQLKKE